MRGAAHVYVFAPARRAARHGGGRCAALRLWPARLTNSAVIETGGDNAEGILAQALGSGDVTVTNHAGATITTDGVGSKGIRAVARGAGAVTVTNSAGITTKGRSSDGIDARAQGGGTVTVTNSAGATITTEGLASQGIEAGAVGQGDAIVRNFGTITTKYYNATVDAASQSDTAVDVLGASGTADMDGLGGGGSLTFYGANGLYADLLGLATFYSTDLSAEGLGKLGMPNGIGYAASFELGKEYALRSGFSVVPQGQLVYQRIDLDNFTDTTGNPVSSEATDSLEGRLGLAAKATAALDNDMAAAFYTDANIIHEFLDPALVTIGGGTVTYNTNATSFEFGGGFNLFSNNGPVASTLYVDADYRMPLADPGTTVIEARAGMRFSF